MGLSLSSGKIIHQTSWCGHPTHVTTAWGARRGLRWSWGGEEVCKSVLRHLGRRVLWSSSTCLRGILSEKTLFLASKLFRESQETLLA